MTLLDRQIGLVESLRSAGLPVSLAEGLDAVHGLETIPLDDRETLRTVLAATLVKRQTHRAAFDTLFDLYYPALVGAGARQGSPLGDGPADLAEFQERLAQALEDGDRDALAALATEGVGRFGEIKGRAPGQSRWSAYSALHRIHPQQLVDRIVRALVAADRDSEPTAERTVRARVDAFTRLAEGDARRRVAETKGAEEMARHATRPPIESLDFLQARRTDLDELRRQVHPLARRLATRLTQEHHARRRGPLDFRRTVRASLGTGGVPVETVNRPKRPHRSELVVLCDVSGSVANFASFTLMLVYALREQFTRVRAFTFVDDVHEVTQHFRPGADPVDTLALLAASAEHASRFGRTNYGRAFERFAERHGDAVGPRSSLLILGDARSNHSDLALDTLRGLAGSSRHAWWLNPEHRRHWDTGDSAAERYGAIVPMVECRNLVQLGEFVRLVAG